MTPLVNISGLKNLEPLIEEMASGNGGGSLVALAVQELGQGEGAGHRANAR